MRYQEIQQLHQVLGTAYQQLSTNLNQLDILVKATAAVTALDQGYQLLSQPGQLVINQHNIKRLLSRPRTMLHEFLKISQNDKVVLAQSAKINILQTSKDDLGRIIRLVATKINLVQEVIQEDIKKQKPVEKRITNLEELAAALDSRNKQNRQKESEERIMHQIQATQRDGGGLEGVGNNLEYYEQYRRKVPRRVRDKIGFEAIRIPILIIPNKMLDLKAVRSSQPGLSSVSLRGSSR